MPLWGIVLRGMLMGAADIVPGVSGGTMAFITGIYARLLAAISAFDVTLMGLLAQRRWRDALARVDAAFLLALVSGIAISVFSLARLISHWLATQPLLLWSFFFGLILASSLMLMRHVRDWSPPAVVGLLLGAGFAGLLGFAPALALPAGLPSFFLAGFVAICAMILPGISGSFILVLLGMYPPVLAAVENLDLPALGLFCAGAGCGLLVFSRLLSVLLQRYHAPTLATLTGFLFGSLLVVWPWKLAVDGAMPRPVLPQVYAQQLGDSQWLFCSLLITLGLLLVWLLESRWGGLER